MDRQWFQSFTTTNICLLQPLRCADLPLCCRSAQAGCAVLKTFDRLEESFIEELVAGGKQVIHKSSYICKDCSVCLGKIPDLQRMWTVFIVCIPRPENTAGSTLLESLNMVISSTSVSSKSTLVLKSLHFSSVCIDSLVSTGVCTLVGRPWVNSPHFVKSVSNSSSH